MPSASDRMSFLNEIDCWLQCNVAGLSDFMKRSLYEKIFSLHIPLHMPYASSSDPLTSSSKKDSQNLSIVFLKISIDIS